jgi:hypothetical protein
MSFERTKVSVFCMSLSAIERALPRSCVADQQQTLRGDAMITTAPQCSTLQLHVMNIYRRINDAHETSACSAGFDTKTAACNFRRCAQWQRTNLWLVSQSVSDLLHPFAARYNR